MKEFVLDSWGLIEWLEDRRPAADRMESLLKAAERGEATLLMNIVNVGEVFYVCAKRRGMNYGRHVMQILHPRLATFSASDQLVMLAATLKAQHKISYADGFAAATAILHNAPLVTGDPEFRTMAANEKSLILHWIG